MRTPPPQGLRRGRLRMGPRMDTNEDREWTRLRQAYGAAGYEWTRNE